MSFDIPREKWLKYLQTVDHDQTPCSVASDLRLDCYSFRGFPNTMG